MKKEILKQFDNLGHGQIGLENGDFIDFEVAKNFISKSLEEYADWKIKECLPEKAKDLYFNALKYPKEAIGSNQAFGYNACIDQILTNKDKIK